MIGGVILGEVAGAIGGGFPGFWVSLDLINVVLIPTFILLGVLIGLSLFVPWIG